ncbi:hypothetical protein [Planomonospora sphaerica]|uniref:hypothetical protein n=1 Tax=Planomonospora sphaerica TaxID=161355 RepID=UPI0012F762AA|nr:hypothetical protein [Planomonospora sphaerica]
MSGYRLLPWFLPCLTADGLAAAIPQADRAITAQNDHLGELNRSGFGGALM